MTQQDFLEKLAQACQVDTSADPDGWTVDNPLWGHCAVAAVLAQEYFGGRIRKASLQDHPKYAYLRSHFWNELPDGTQIDVTAAQYPDLLFTELSDPQERTPENILSHPGARERYELLKKRFESL